MEQWIVEAFDTFARLTHMSVMEQWIVEAFDAFARLTHMSIGATYVVVLIVAALLAVVIASICVYRREIGMVRVASTFLIVPVCFSAILLSLSAFRGVVDDKCQYYGGGQETFTYISGAVVLANPQNQYGKKWFVMLIRGERWGNEVHYCRLKMSDPKARAVAKALSGVENRAEYSIGGEITFSFGGKHEIPNAQFKARNPVPGKDGPPERPPRGA